MASPKTYISDLWVQHQRKNTKISQSWACIYCPDRRIFATEPALWEHGKTEHGEKLEGINTDLEGNTDLEAIRAEYGAASCQKRPTKDTQKPTLNEAPMRDLSDDSQAADEDLPRKRTAIGDRISAGSGSPFRDSSPPASPRRSKARHSGQYDSTSDTDSVPRNMLDPPGRPQRKRQLWQEGQAPLTKASFNDPSNIASIAVQKARAQQSSPRPRKPYTPLPQSFQSSRPIPQITPIPSVDTTSTQRSSTVENFDLVLQPETRPISQEQLVAEVKGIYAGLVMVEAKCIEVDNKQATLAQADPGAQPKLNNEQWQALIALHRTLLHEHHDFFLASQHPSASAALRRLAAKYAMPARMWRHGIHSFLELLRHRLPASLDHMLAFIYLAYSMMALLYETVPAFEDTWIECLGDLGRYRMAIEDDDIRDREVWTGVARHWYSRASDKSPTTGRLYHHLAILARPNALQQLFYYAKSLCVVIPFTSARESILTLFNAVLNAENSQGQYRLPPLDTSFVKAHGILFTNKNMDQFEPTINEFLGLLDNQIGRVTRKFMEQGYHIAVANTVAMLGFAYKDNVLMKAMTNEDCQVTSSLDSEASFRYANRLSNSTLEIALRRIRDPNVLAFIHVTFVFMHNMSRHPGAMQYLQPDFPWELLSTMLNTLLASNGQSSCIEEAKFPPPDKDDVHPFPEDFAMRGLLWTKNYFPDGWFTNEKIHADTLLDITSEPSLQNLNTCSKAFQDKVQSQDLPNQYPEGDLNIAAKYASPHSKSERWFSILHRLRDYTGFLGFSTFFAQFSTIKGSSTASTEYKSIHMLPKILEPAAAELAVTLAAGVMGARFVHRYLDIDMWLLLIFIFNLGILILPQDARFSDGELLVLCLYETGINFHWMKNKLMKLPKTGGVTAFGLGSLGLYTGWKLAPQFPGLEARFDNQLIPRAIASLPPIAGYSMAWSAIIEQTGLAKAIEGGLDNPQNWEFIIPFLKAVLVRFFERIIEAITECLLGYVHARVEGNMFQVPAQDVEADPRAFIPRHESLRGPSNENFFRQESEDGVEDRWNPLSQY